MPKRDTPSDLDAYLPDKATLAARMAEPDEHDEVDPELVAKLRRMGTNPNIMRVAPPSEAVVYIPPAELPGAADDERTLPRDEPKVKLALPPGPTEMPTQPSLRRLQGEPEVPGVVSGPPVRGSSGVGHADGRPLSVRTATLAVLAVLVPVVLVIIVMGRIMRRPEPVVVPGATTTSAPVVVPAAQPTVSIASATAPSAVPSIPSTAPSATSSAAAMPVPTGSAAKRRAHPEPEDPYDRALAPPTAAVTAPPQGTAAPSATAPAATAPTATPLVPTAPPATAPSKGPEAPPAQKPEF